LSRFSLVEFGFVIFWHQNIGTKCAKNVDEIDTCSQYYKTFYTKLLLAQIPKAQKGTGDLFVFWDMFVYKLIVNMLVKSTPDVNLTNILL